jgi:hypothetical protein
MKKFKFLGPVSALAAAFSNDHALASQEPLKANTTDTDYSVSGNALENITMSNGKDTFNFVLRRVEGGQLMAYHSSHGSHGSHGSHRSHSSGF